MKSSKYKTAKIFQVQLFPGTIFNIKPNHKYLVVFDKEGYNEKSLSYLDEALKSFFGEAKVLAIFTKDLSKVKIAEVLE